MAKPASIDPASRPRLPLATADFHGFVRRLFQSAALRRPAQRSASPRNRASARWALAILIAGILLTYAAWRVTRASEAEGARHLFERHVAETAAAISGRILDYELILRGGVGLFNASSSVEREEWRKYIESLHIDERYPGIKAVGYAQRVEPSELDAHVKAIRAEGFPDYEVRPAGRRGEATPVVYVETFSGRNPGANRDVLGYDMFSEPLRREAMMRARDTGNAALSGLVLIADAGQQGNGALLYQPVYRPGADLATIAFRREALLGYVYNSLRVPDLVRAVVGERSPDLEFRIFDGLKADPESLLYEDARPLGRRGNAYQPLFEHALTITVGGRPWTLTFATRPAFDAQLTSRAPLVLLSGLALTALLVIGFASLATARERAQAIADRMTQAYRESEGRARAIVSGTADGIVTLNEAGIVQTFNPAAESIFGYAADQVIGNGIGMLTPARLRISDERFIADFIAPPTRFLTGSRREITGLRNDGTEFPMYFALNSITEKSGRQFVAILSDISERKEAEAKLAASEKHLRLIIDNVPAMIAYVNSEERLVFMNEPFERALGRPATRFLGRTMRDAFGHKTYEELKHYYDAVFSGQTVRFERVAQIDGAVKHSSVVYTPDFDDAGKVRGFYGLGFDITDHMRTKEALKETEEFNRRVVESSHDCIELLDLEGRLLFISEGAARELDICDVGFFIGAQWLDLWKGDDRNLAALALESARNGKVGRFTGFFPTFGGTPKWWEVIISPLLDAEHKPERLLAVSRDITERKEKEERIAASLAEKEVLLGEIHHRVKNNLQIIYSLLDLQAARIEDGATLAALRDSQHRIKSMALIHQTLYQSHDFARVNFGSFVKTLMQYLSDTYPAAAERVALRVDAADVLLPINTAIPCGLIVNELVSNALKHAFPGETRGEVRIEIVHAAAGALIAVSDNGVGVPAGQNLETVATLGLQLVRLLAEQVGATLEIQRAAPTRFVLKLSRPAEMTDDHSSSPRHRDRVTS